MVHFVGAGPGAQDLITQRGAVLLQAADCIIYAGSLVNPALLGLAKAGCAIYNSAEMTLEQVLDVMRRMEAAGKTTVRLHAAAVLGCHAHAAADCLSLGVLVGGLHLFADVCQYLCDGPHRRPRPGRSRGRRPGV